MKCPHCLVDFHPPFAYALLAWENGRGSPLKDVDGYWRYNFTVCPTCKRSTIFLRLEDGNNKILNEIMVWPKGIARAPLPNEVPAKYAGDYREACKVLADSPKA